MLPEATVRIGGESAVFVTVSFKEPLSDPRLFRDSPWLLVEENHIDINVCSNNVVMSSLWNDHAMTAARDTLQFENWTSLIIQRFTWLHLSLPDPKIQ